MSATQNTIPKDWQEVRLGDIATITRGGSPRPIESFITDEKDGLNWLRIGDIEASAKYITHTSQKIKKEGLSKTTLVKNGDFILSNSMSFGRPYIMKTEACIHDGWLAFKDIKLNIVNIEFLYYLFESDLLQNNFKTIAAGSGVKNLKKESVSNIFVDIPLISEQKKIAEILSNIDLEIGKIKEIISQLEKLKDGILREIFTTGINHKNFKKTKIGNIPVEWDVKRLEEVVFFENGKAHENFIDDNGNFIVVNSKFIAQNGEVVKRTNKGLKILNKGDIAIVMSDIPRGKALAKCFFVDEDNKYTLNQRIGLLRPLGSYSKYFFYFLNRNKYFLNFSNETSQTNLRKQQVLDCPIAIPPVSEQEKIAEIILSIDEKLSINILYKEKLLELKKGLSQDLLTGKVRTINS